MEINNKTHSITYASASINFQTCTLFSGASVQAVDWNQGYLIDSDDIISSDWHNRILNDANGNSSVDWSNHYLYDNNINVSLDWQNRNLYDATNGITLSWDNAGVVNIPNLVVPTIMEVTSIKSYSLSGQLIDSNSYASVNWQDRQLIASDGGLFFDWSNFSASLDGGHWQDYSPTTLIEAINRIAAVISGNGSTPIAVL